MAYPKVEPQPRFPGLEERVADRWRERSTFFESIARREAAGADEFVFYDGPPFANGLPHYGHLLTGYVKDAVPRYKTMRGYVVHRRFGWDCHGLPAEVEAERELGISGHPEITAYGIADFNEFCRTSVLRYTAEWQRYVERQARWVDFENDYKTLDLDYMESVMWAFKSLWDRGLIYEGFRVLAYCWRCETPLSNTETRMDDVYRDRPDPALTVAFDLDTGERLLAWTTTPWTLPANLALAVAPDLEYVVVEREGRRYVLAADRLGAYADEFPDAVPVERLRGADLVGRRYRPLFDFFADTPNAFQVLAGDFVSTDDGTGVVHLAPGFGEEDQLACNAADIPTIVPMDEHGRYTAEVPPWVGRHVFDANPLITERLVEAGAVLRAETYEHSYPHCWRCEQPLVYRAISSWFVEVTKFRQRMVELNEQITWVPDHLKHGSFGKWLENARDWSISRNRFWGSPIPVWRSDDPAYPRVDVYGSLAELAADFGVEITDLHRPMVDELVRPNPDDPSGRSMMRRVPEVLDCWFESGSMPFAQVHYPFRNRDWFESHFPGDFIVEYTGQTRGWFYTLHVLATALFDRPAFRTCVSHGIILGEDGQKMSKSLRNYPDPMEVFDTHGSDAMRWYLLSSPILRGNDFSVTAAGLRETARQILLPLWNAWYFLALYANVEGYQGEVRTAGDQSDHVLDRYVLAKTRELVDEMTEAMDAYDLYAACVRIRSFVEVLTNWYIRRSRQRFWDGDHAAVDTLHTVLETLVRVAAPLLPHVTDEIFAGLNADRHAADSVHLTDWPDGAALLADDELVGVMDQVRDVCSAALSVRKAHGRRVRQPLTSMTVATPHAGALRPFAELVADEVNVREVEFTDDVTAVAGQVLQVLPAAIGPRLGPHTQDVIKAVRAGDWKLDGDRVLAGGQWLEPGEYTLTLVAEGDRPGTTLAGGTGVIVLDVELTPELEQEGRARDVIRLVQQARRDADLAVTDRIRLTVKASAVWIGAIRTHEALVAGETLAVEVSTDDAGDDNPEITVERA
jgi:isoleucyl-tRNA synthetase